MSNKYRQVKDSASEPVAKAIRELYDFVHTLKGEVQKVAKAPSQPTVSQPVASTDVQSELAAKGLNLGLTGPIQISSGYGSPEGIIMGNIGHLYLNLSGGATTTLYVKETGNATKTGWVAK